MLSLQHLPRSASSEQHSVFAKSFFCRGLASPLLGTHGAHFAAKGACQFFSCDQTERTQLRRGHANVPVTAVRAHNAGVILISFWEQE